MSIDKPRKITHFWGFFILKSLYQKLLILLFALMNELHSRYGCVNLAVKKLTHVHRENVMYKCALFPKRDTCRVWLVWHPGKYRNVSEMTQS